MAKKRKDVAKEDCWNVEVLYPTFSAWEKDLKNVISEKKPPFFQSMKRFQGKLGTTASTLYDALEHYFAIERKLRKLYTYAHLRHDEDIANEVYKKAYDQISTLYTQFAQELAWFEPEILSIDQKKLAKFLQDKKLANYSFYLEKLLRLKPHVLDASAEQLMAMAGQPLQSIQNAFSAINNADFKFGAVAGKDGVEKELTHATYGLFLRSPDRMLRKNAFHTYHSKYMQFENSLAELLSGQIQKHYFEAQARKFPSCLQAALFPKNIDPKVYHALIEAVHSKISSLHKYFRLRKKLLKLKEVHLYDLFIPLTQQFDKKYSYDEAEQLVIESVKPLGEEYTKLLHDGLKKGRWVDRYENQNKRSGAYSSGCYDSMPYILMNYKGILRDLYTLSHEAGHSMHSLLSRQTQPYHYSDYAIFVAEVASTFNEELLSHTLLQKVQSKEERAFLLCEMIEDIRSTLFRQTMFAEFELFLHETIEKREPLTPAVLKHKYLELNHLYFGNEVVLDQLIAIEWARIPHFYYGFYVYQYATGISAAIALSEQVLHGGKKEKDAYLNFLRSGSSDYPLALLKKAGIDMCSPKPIVAAIEKFSAMVNELESLLV